MEKELLNEYSKKKVQIKKRLTDFKKVKEDEIFYEMIFCLLTPQSNAKKCWQAVEKIKKLDKFELEEIKSILSTHTRFHNNKARYLLEAEKTFNEIKQYLDEKDKIKLRNLISQKIKGYGLKEASHFLRNIGKSQNQIAILDRHILRNLKEEGIINKDKIKNNKDYLEIEQKMIDYSKKLNIPIDELDLLFWSKENGEIFK